MHHGRPRPEQGAAGRLQSREQLVRSDFRLYGTHMCSRSSENGFRQRGAKKETPPILRRNEKQNRSAVNPKSADEVKLLLRQTLLVFLINPPAENTRRAVLQRVRHLCLWVPCVIPGSTVKFITGMGLWRAPRVWR